MRPMTWEQYQQSLKNGWDDERLKAEGYEIPAPPAQAATRPQAPPAQAATKPQDDGGFNPARQPDIGRTAMQSVPLIGPWLDEAEGAMRGVGGYLADKVRGRDTSLKGSIARATDDVQGSIAATRKKMGGAGVAGELALGLAGGNAALKGAGPLFAKFLGADPVKSAPGVTNYLTRNAARVGSGAATGAFMGAGAADDGDRATGAVGGMLFGGTMNALPALIEAGQGVKRFGQSLAMHRGPQAKAGAELAATMSADDLLGKRAVGKYGAPNFQPATQSALTRAPEFPGQTVADVAANVPNGGYTDQLLRESVAIPGYEGGAIKRAMAERAGGRAARIDDALTTGSSFAAERPEVVKKAVDAARKPNIKSLYQAATGRARKPIDSDELRDILEADDPFVKKALSYANQKMKANRVPEPGYRTASGMIAYQDYNAPMIDYTKRGIDAQISTFIKQGNLADARAAMITRERLVTEADKLIPGYAEARAADEGRRALNSAMDLGRKLGKGNIDVREAEDMVARITPKSPDFATPDEVQTMFRRGVADGIRRRLGKAKDGVGALKAVIGSDNAKEVTRLAFPDDASFQAFEKTLMDELRQIPAEGMVGGARSNPQFLSTDALGSASPWAVKQALTGQPMLLAAQTAGTLSGQAKRRGGEALARELAGVAGEKVGSARAQIVNKAIKRQQAVPRWMSQAAGKDRTSASKTNPVLQRLFQTFMLQLGSDQQ